MAEQSSTTDRHIFISYRRDDSIAHVNGLFLLLREHFGKHRVFKDTDNIPPGRDFRKVIETQLQSCSVLLAVIGKNWVTAQKPKSNTRRLDDPNDYLRIEVSKALKDEGVLVIPILVGQATMPSAEELPDDLTQLSYLNAFELRDSRWESDIRLLIEAIEGAELQIRQAPAPAARVAAVPEPPFAARVEPPPIAAPDDGFDLLELRRRRQIAEHMKTAREAFAALDYEVAVEACEKAIWLDAQNAEARELRQRARAALDEQKITGWLGEAQEVMKRPVVEDGDLTVASGLIDQALALRPAHPLAVERRQELLSIRKQRERQREIDRQVRAALARAQASFDEEDFDAAVEYCDDALLLAGESEAARQLRQKSVIARAEQQRQRDLKRRARQVAGEAERAAAAEAARRREESQAEEQQAAIAAAAAADRVRLDTEASEQQALLEAALRSEAETRDQQAAADAALQAEAIRRPQEEAAAEGARRAEAETSEQQALLEIALRDAETREQQRAAEAVLRAEEEQNAAAEAVRRAEADAREQEAAAEAARRAEAEADAREQEAATEAARRAEAGARERESAAEAARQAEAAAREQQVAEAARRADLEAGLPPTFAETLPLAEQGADAGDDAQVRTAFVRVPPTSVPSFFPDRTTPPWPASARLSPRNAVAAAVAVVVLVAIVVWNLFGGGNSVVEQTATGAPTVSEAPSGSPSARPAQVAEVPPRASKSGAAATPPASEGAAADAAPPREDPAPDPAVGELAALRQRAMTHFQAGERAEALETSMAGLRLAPDDADLVRTMAALRTDAESSVQKAKQAAPATRVSPAAAAKIKEAAQKEAEAVTFARNNRPDEAIRSLWAAADLYTKAGEGAADAASQLTAITARARRQLQSGQRAEALESTTEGLRLDPAHAPLRRIAATLWRDAETAVDQSKEKAADRGADSAPEFDEAERKAAEAVKLRAANRFGEAVKSMWAASELFAKATERPAPREPARPAAPAPATREPASNVPQRLESEIFIARAAAADVMRDMAAGRGAIDHVSEVARGGPVAAVIRTSGCQQDGTGNCKLSADVVVYAPDGSAYQEATSVELTANGGAVPLRIDARAPAGVYRVVVLIRDLVSRRFAKLERQFGVK